MVPGYGLGPWSGAIYELVESEMGAGGDIRFVCVCCGVRVRDTAVVYSWSLMLWFFLKTTAPFQHLILGRCTRFVSRGMGRPSHSRSSSSTQMTSWHCTCTYVLYWWGDSYTMRYSLQASTCTMALNSQRNYYCVSLCRISDESSSAFCQLWATDQTCLVSLPPNWLPQQAD